jgi:hypothetical protein
MLRIVVCCAVLLALIAAMKFGLRLSLADFGLWPYLAICVAVGLAGMFIAHLIDRADTRSREVQPPTPPGFR